MATLSSTFTLNNPDGTDPINISISPSFNITDPSGSGSYETAPAVLQQIISAGENSDFYVLIRNVGMATGTKHGRVIIKNGLNKDIASLRLNDFLFMPVKAGVGLQALYDDHPTTVQYFFWTRL
jgi:hypothetical protein